jgi:hypothetical protein
LVSAILISMPIKPPRRSVNEQRRCSSPRPKNADAENVTLDIPLRLGASPRKKRTMPPLRHTAAPARHPFRINLDGGSTRGRMLYLGKAANEQNVETLDLSR